MEQQTLERRTQDLTGRCQQSIFIAELSSYAARYSAMRKALIGECIEPIDLLVDTTDDDPTLGGAIKPGVVQTPFALDLIRRKKREHQDQAAALDRELSVARGVFGSLVRNHRRRDRCSRPRTSRATASSRVRRSRSRRNSRSASGASSDPGGGDPEPPGHRLDVAGSNNADVATFRAFGGNR